MLRRFIQVFTLLAVSVGLTLIAGSGAALAHGGSHHGHKHSHKAHRSGDNEKGDRGDRGDRGSNECHRGDKGNDSGDEDHGNGRNCEKGSYSAWDEQWLMMSIEGDRF